MDIQTFACTSKGGRDYNEDYYGYYWAEGGGCWVVADGLGGHAGGEAASRFVTEAVINSAGRWLSFADEELIALLQETNQSLVRAQGETPAHKGMKTTVVAVFVEKGILKHIHVGDSRFYYFHANRIVTLTRDHSISRQAADLGEIDEADIRFHEDRNVVLKVMGMTHLNLAGTVGTITPEPGDAFLLCSDGFWEYVYETEMIDALARADGPERWLEGMVARLQERVPDGHDNFTAVCCMVTQEASMEIQKAGMEREIPKTAVYHGAVSITGLDGFFARKALHVRAGDVITIGRNRGACTLLFPPDHANVSAIHCELYYDNVRKRIILTDKDSKNGTFVQNGRRLEPGACCELQDGDTFYLADPSNMFLVRIH